MYTVHPGRLPNQIYNNFLNMGVSVFVCLFVLSDCQKLNTLKKYATFIKHAVCKEPSNVGNKCRALNAEFCHLKQKTVLINDECNL